MSSLEFANLAQQLDRIELLLSTLLDQQTQKEFYSTSEVAKLVSRSNFSVREWCRLGRVRAEKRLCGRGNKPEWKIAHVELVRIQNEGLLPR